MAGKPGRSGGHNRLPAAEHLLRGTFRPDRHGASFQPWPGPNNFKPLEPIDPPRALIRGLGAAGKRFMRDLFAECIVGKVEGHIARIAAESLDDLAAARRASDAKAARAATRQFLNAVQRLGLPVPVKP